VRSGQRNALTLARTAGYDASGVPRVERVSVDLEVACAHFAARATECVDLWADSDVDEPGCFEHALPARTGQPTGDSVGPEVDVV
jgi:hypothetical protein